MFCRPDLQVDVDAVVARGDCVDVLGLPCKFTQGLGDVFE